MSRSPEWWREQFSSFLERSAALLVERIGPLRARSIFLCGSFSTDEGSVVLETEPPIVLSDVDLVAVVESLADLAVWYRRRSELGAACEALLPSVRFAGRVDVGVMLPADLERLPARPGVLDMRRHGRVLAGDPAMLERIPAFEGRAIGAAEALVLVENRMAALLGAYPAGGNGEDPYPFLYSIARVYTDIAVSALSLAGSYRSGYRDRAASVAALASEQPEGAGKLLSDPLLRGIERWTAFKLDPRISTAGIDAAPRTRRALWEAAAADILVFWRRAAGSAVRGAAGGDGVSPVREIFRRRPRGGSRRGNLIAWRSLLAPMPVRDRLAIAAGAGGTLLARAPLDVVREEAVRLIEASVSGRAAERQARQAGGFPHRGGTWEEAAASTHAAWRALVFGRTEG